MRTREGRSTERMRLAANEVSKGKGDALIRQL
jgi:hypothetical protein